jgi:hypothetical protein
VRHVQQQPVPVARAHQRPPGVGQAAVPAAAAGGASAAVSLPQRAESADPGGGEAGQRRGRVLLDDVAPLDPQEEGRAPGGAGGAQGVRRVDQRQLGRVLLDQAAGVIDLPPEAARRAHTEAGEQRAAEDVDPAGADLGEVEVQTEGVPVHRGPVAGGQIEGDVADLGQQIVVQIDHQRAPVQLGHLLGDGDGGADHAQPAASRAATSSS